MAAPEFEPIHHVILNCAAFICLQTMTDDDRMDLMVGRLAEALAVAPRDTGLRDRLCSIAQPLTHNSEARHGMQWAHARLVASGALANLFYWRAGLADAAAKGEENAA